MTSWQDLRPRRRTHNPRPAEGHGTSTWRCPTMTSTTTDQPDQQQPDPQTCHRCERPLLGEDTVLDLPPMATTGAGSRGGRIVTRRITRGKRKGQTVQGYVDRRGRFTAIKTNRTKGARAGKKFVTTRDSKGRRVHTYVLNGKRVSVTMKKSRKSKDQAKNRRGALTRASFGRHIAGEKPKRKRKRKKGRK